MGSSLVSARESYERREWVAACESLAQLDATELDGDDFTRLATAAHLSGRTDDSVQAMQRAYQMRLAGNDRLGAVRSAFWLAHILLTNGESAVADGWIARANRLLNEVPGDVVERGYVLTSMLMQHVFAGEFTVAVRYAEQITDYGRRFRHPDLMAMGLCCQGRLALYAGRVREGLTLMDEAMAGLAAGEVSTIFAGQIYCTLIEACQQISDYRRAEEWTMALTTWCADQPGLVLFTGQCAVHRGQLMRLHGAYDAALEEFGYAVDRYLAAGTTAAAGLAMAECGDVFRILGDYDSAERAYRSASGHQYEPQPGLALLWLARGRMPGAVGAMRRLVAETPDPVHRSGVLPAAVDVLLAAGEFDEAAALSAELSRISADFGCAALRAMAHRAAGCVALARAEYAAAVPELRRAARTWAELDAPYEAAWCRVALGRGFRGLGDGYSADSELTAARQVFIDLGAAPAARSVTELLHPTTPGGLTAREVEVLRLVAAGHSNPEIAATLVLSDKTVARHLSNIFAKIDVSSRTAAATFACTHQLI